MWERSVLVARRCLGKGSTEDKQTLGLDHGLLFYDNVIGEEEEAMELGRQASGSRLLPIETIQKIQKISNKCSVKKQCFTYNTHNTTPVSHEDTRPIPTLSRNLINNQHYLIAAH